MFQQQGTHVRRQAHEQTRRLGCGKVAKNQRQCLGMLLPQQLIELPRAHPLQRFERTHSLLRGPAAHGLPGLTLSQTIGQQAPGQLPVRTDTASLHLKEYTGFPQGGPHTAFRYMRQAGHGRRDPGHLLPLHAAQHGCGHLLAHVQQEDGTALAACQLRPLPSRWP